jgi:hypothetical protein
VRPAAGRAPVQQGRATLARRARAAGWRAAHLEGCLRQIDFLDGEIEALERVLARQVLGSLEARRLMTVPGFNMLTAATFMASGGEIGRFPSPRKLVSYLGLDRRVHQSGWAHLYLERFRGWTRVLVEAIPEPYRHCVQERPHSKVFKCALVAPDVQGTTVLMR